MTRAREVIVVEGKYDRIRVLSAVDALVVETDGFGIFRDKEKAALLRTLARDRGLVVLTDSDAAGFVIRNHLNGLVPPEQIRHAYIPECPGKEKRKAAPSREGLLGVEGMDSTVILAALRRAGATFSEGSVEGEQTQGRQKITKLDFYEAGLTGAANSSVRRAHLLERLGLPHRLSANRLLEVLNALMDCSAFWELIGELFTEKERCEEAN